MGCPECEKKKKEQYNARLTKAKEEAKRHAEKNKLEKMVIVETVNGISAYRKPGNESLDRLRIIDTLYFFT